MEGDPPPGWTVGRTPRSCDFAAGWHKIPLKLAGRGDSPDREGASGESLVELLGGVDGDLPAVGQSKRPRSRLRPTLLVSKRIVGAVHEPSPTRATPRAGPPPRTRSCSTPRRA